MSYYRQQKPAKAETPSKSLITTIWPHTTQYKIIERKEETIVMVDPGTRNFCIRVETRTLDAVMKPKLFAKWDIAEADASGEEISIITPTLTRKLNGYRHILETADRVIIERQLPINYNSTLIMQHTQSYFEMLLADKPNLPTIHLVDPKLKSRILAKRAKMTKPELKAWSPGEAIKWLIRQHDEWSVKIIEEARKKDDYADVVVMREAFYRYIQSPFSTPDNPEDCPLRSLPEVVPKKPKILFVIKERDEQTTE